MKNTFLALLVGALTFGALPARADADIAHATCTLNAPGTAVNYVAWFGSHSLANNTIVLGRGITLNTAINLCIQTTAYVCLNDGPHYGFNRITMTGNIGPTFNATSCNPRTAIPRLLEKVLPPQSAPN